MPPRYLAGDEAEDVLLHWRVLDASVEKRAVVRARYVKSIKVRAGYNGSHGEFGKPCQRLMEGSGLEVDDSDSRITSSRRRVIPIHEIAFCSVDRPRLLCRLATLVEESGLHIRECHLDTIHGSCLALFLVDGWETEETDGLIDQIRETLKENAKQCNSTKSPASEEILNKQQILEILQLTGAITNNGENIESSAGISGKGRETEVSEDAGMAELGN